MQNKPYLQNYSLTNIRNPINEVVRFLPSNIHQNTKYPMAKAKLFGIIHPHPHKHLTYNLSSCYKQVTSCSNLHSHNTYTIASL